MKYSAASVIPIKNVLLVNPLPNVIVGYDDASLRCNLVEGLTSPIPTFPSPLKLRTFVPPAINEPVSAPAQPNPVFPSCLLGTKTGTVEVASEFNIRGLFVPPTMSIALELNL